MKKIKKREKLNKTENKEELRLCCGSDLYKNTIESYVRRRTTVEDKLSGKNKKDL
ncbi:hypothetical protein [Anaerosphaera multitolerans]|uniref:hypothetical protein n=1 Tax=Anaerosphaera multitolerans TaxID=2487351 RepID=UPI0013E35B29|nr:hypothetical protein [Anaerosphaera multitolerans]